MAVTRGGLCPRVLVHGNVVNPVLDADRPEQWDAFGLRQIPQTRASDGVPAVCA